MMFASSDINHWSLKEAKELAERVLAYGTKHHSLSQTQMDQLSYIIAPTLDPNQHQDKIMELWRELVETLVIVNDKGVAHRFYLDEADHMIYFGDEKGIELGRELHKANTID